MQNSDKNKERLFRIQREMQRRIDNSHQLVNYHYAGGADLTDRDGMIVGCFVVIDCQYNFKIIYKKCTEMRVTVQYQAGLLCFREGPVVVALYNEFKEKCPNINLDLIICDGSGEWHPRGLGLASYVGVELQIPTIGVFKNFLYIGSQHNKEEIIEEAHQQCINNGDFIIMEHTIRNGCKVSCAVMKTEYGRYFNPIYISPGNLIDLNSSIEIVKRLCRFREPEPTRLADRISRRYIQNKTSKFYYRYS
ncbi:hypothetical protein M9Y10_036625 [Tritrichomonas musculus]|uniref:Endonuclease V n=1 Tax=Tritrichomonas musculus TaxID=1915356 RepID=A0ABR2GTD8_9EUKA